jgi:hypothetical protein
MSQNSAIFVELLPVSFCLFVVKFLATVAKIFTKIEKTERKAFEKARSALEVLGFSNLYFYLVYGKCHKILPIFFELASFFFCLFVVKILATGAKTFTKIENNERKAFEKALSAFEVGLSRTCILS